jgi:hypothetical protein
MLVIDQPLVVGARFGGLVLLYQVKSRGDRVPGLYNWICRCDCGKEFEVLARYLETGRSKTCGCRIVTSKRFKKNSPTLPGTRFGKLVVEEEVSSLEIRCKCDCGTSVIRKRSLLVLGDAKTCGGGCSTRDPSSRTEREHDLFLRSKFSVISADIKRRDRFICVLCEKVGNFLHTHHIEPWSRKPELRFDPTNLVTLCKRCHIDRAHGGSLKFGVTDPSIAEILKQYIVGIYAGGGVEKNANLELTDDERLLILSGIRPERIARNWSDVSLEELVEIVNKPRNTKGDN